MNKSITDKLELKSFDQDDHSTKDVNFHVDRKSIYEEESDGVKFGFFEGYASTFGNEDLVGDIIEKGAFRESIVSGVKVRLLWQHDWHTPIGSFTELREDDRGLFVKARINLETEKGRECYSLLKAGDIDSMSIGYRVQKCRYSEDREVRFLEKVSLHEVSVVTFPANPSANVTDVKSRLQNADSLADIEKVLKEQGFSTKAAKLLISRVKSVINGEEAVKKDDTTENDTRDAKFNTQMLLDSLLKSVKTDPMTINLNS